jgi:hypothetical protein
MSKLSGSGSESGEPVGDVLEAVFTKDDKEEVSIIGVEVDMSKTNLSGS